jgi:hypothetical protein
MTLPLVVFSRLGMSRYGRPPASPDPFVVLVMLGVILFLASLASP